MDAASAYQQHHGICRYTLRICGDVGTRVSAADVNDLATALGYEQINLWGWSYGTRLSLMVMRHYPQIVRSATLDSVVPPERPPILTRVAQRRALDALFAACNADAACATAYPNLEETVFTLAEQLNDTPLTVEVPGDEGDFQEIPITGEMFLSRVIGTLNWAQGYQQALQIIADIDAGNTDSFLQNTSGVVLPQFSLGLNYAVGCREEFATHDAAALAYAQETYLPQLNPSFSRPGMNATICNGFDSGDPLPEITVPVYSTIPTLLVAGEFDPSTPPSHTRKAGDTLPNSYYVEVPAGAHGETLFSSCPQQIMSNFFADPSTAPGSA